MGWKNREGPKEHTPLRMRTQLRCELLEGLHTLPDLYFHFSFLIDSLCSPHHSYCMEVQCLILKHIHG